MASNNPVNLCDSRLFGLVPDDHLIGKAWRIWFSSRKRAHFSTSAIMENTIIFKFGLSGPVDIIQNCLPVRRPMWNSMTIM